MKKIKNNFLKDILILVYSQAIIKILGLAYSVYLTNKEGFGDNGNAIYMSGYQIYALLLALSSIGVPNAISKLVAERYARKDYHGAEQIFRIALILFFIIGFCGTIFLFCGSKFISNEILKIPEAEKTLKILSSAIFFVSVSSVFRGYFNGVGEISYTAKSQIVEQIFKTILTFLFVEFISKLSEKDVVNMSAMATLATTLATIFSFFYCLMRFKKIQNISSFQSIPYKKEGFINVAKRILAISIPISLSSIISAINKNIDSITVVRILSPIIGKSLAKSKYGILSSKVDILVTMPLAFNIAISTILVPTISRENAVKNMEKINDKVVEAIYISTLIGLPCTFGMAMYSKQILKMIFPNASLGGNLLFIESFSIIFAMLTQTINGILQGIGKNKVPAIAFGCGIIIKFFINIFLIPIKGIYENGAAVGTVACNIVAFTIVYNVLCKSINLKNKIADIVSIPLFSTILMCGCSYLFYAKISMFVGFYFSMITTIIFSIVIYFLLIYFLTKIKKNFVHRELMP